ncbi:hypothetical protein AWZ03_005106 [Drosophila navojoa]|uniref:Uncharacterized protein n=1 Tax=Drosophila navojoa TaxID=7232 RepID=A0A484BK23_DRONA|nr:hypothetical protein AWZ03_005106 [Drosophila navojoa]
MVPVPVPSQCQSKFQFHFQLVVAGAASLWPVARSDDVPQYAGIIRQQQQQEQQQPQRDRWELASCSWAWRIVWQPDRQGATPTQARQLINAPAEEPASKYATCNTNSSSSSSSSNNFDG